MSSAFLSRLVGKLTPFFLVVYAVGSGEGLRAAPSFAVASTEIVGRVATLRLSLSDSSIMLVAPDAAPARLELSLVTNGNARALSLSGAHVTKKHGELVVDVDAKGDLPAVSLRLSFDAASDAFAVKLMAPKSPSGDHEARRVGLRLDVSHPKSVFVPGTGVLADVGTVIGHAVMLDDEPLPIAIASKTTSLAATVSGEGASMHLAVASTEESDDAPPPPTGATDAPVEMRIVAARTSIDLASRTFAALGEAVKPLRFVVTGGKDDARVFGADDEGHPFVRVHVKSDEHAVISVPPRIMSWYAAIDKTDTSAPIRFEPGLPWELTLDVSPGGELRVRVVDEQDQPITARIVVHGIDGTLDPSFGPDYRASGAGPIMDSLRGDVVTPVPKGRYRVLATKGIEYSIDAETVDLDSGHSRAIELVLRRVVDTPNMVACDLHVHARPSFDTPVTQEDRVLSLVSAGIELAVPTEHNIVGDYTPSIAVLGVAKDFTQVNGVEVTTYNPRFGHFGVFPYPPGPPPPYKGTNAAQVFSAMRGGDAKRVLVVHHPRLPKQIGYFDVVGFDPQKPQSFQKVRMDFDALEVFNGYEKDSSEKIQRVLDDYYALLNTGRRFAATGSSDSHRIQYQWAGYPRTMAIVDPEKGGIHGKPVDTAAVVSAIKHGHAIVTSGPIVELGIDGKGPGDELDATGKASLSAHVRVRAAPWIDVTSLELIANGKVVAQIPIDSRPTITGKELGDEASITSKVLRWEGNVAFNPPPGTKWVLAIARGKRKLDDVLPFMPTEPIAFTNPLWITGL